MDEDEGHAFERAGVDDVVRGLGCVCGGVEVEGIELLAGGEFVGAPAFVKEFGPEAEDEAVGFGEDDGVAGVRDGMGIGRAVSVARDGVVEEDVAAGFTSASEISSDSDLESLRQEPRYRALLERLGAAPARDASR